MFFYVCLAALIAVATPSCENSPDRNVLTERFCRADIVFRGKAVAGDIGGGQDKNGQRFVSANEHFQVIDYLKSPDYVTQTSQIAFRTFQEGSPCDIEVYPRKADSMVIMGNIYHGPVIQVAACDVHPSWTCFLDAFTVNGTVALPQVDSCNSAN